MHQRHYADMLEPLNVFADYEDFRNLPQKLAWIGHTRPHIIAPVSLLSQATAEKYEGTHLKAIK